MGKKPMFGICLGHQLMALAMGGRTVQMKYGHHGANHPVKDLARGTCSVTAQNHGFMVDPDQLAGGRGRQPPQLERPDGGGRALHG